MTKKQLEYLIEGIYEVGVHEAGKVSIASPNYVFFAGGETEHKKYVADLLTNKFGISIFQVNDYITPYDYVRPDFLQELEKVAAHIIKMIWDYWYVFVIANDAGDLFLRDPKLDTIIDELVKFINRQGDYAYKRRRPFEPKK